MSIEEIEQMVTELERAGTWNKSLGELHLSIENACHKFNEFSIRFNAACKSKGWGPEKKAPYTQINLMQLDITAKTNEEIATQIVATINFRSGLFDHFSFNIITELNNLDKTLFDALKTDYECQKYDWRWVNMPAPYKFQLFCRPKESK